MAAQHLSVRGRNDSREIHLPISDRGAHQAAPYGLGNYRSAISFFLVLICYGSLYPFAWSFDHPQDFIWLGTGEPIGLVDLIENVLLFVPLAWVLAWHYEGRKRLTLYFWRWFVLSLLVASVLQLLQKYLPRTPAASDIVFNMLGYLAGWWAGRSSALASKHWLERHPDSRRFDRFALCMVLIWIIAELFPLIPTLDVSSLKENLKSLWLQDAWQPKRMWAHIGMTIIGLEALASLLKSASRGPLTWPMALVVALAMIGYKFCVVGQSPGLAVVLGIGGGAALWSCARLLPIRLRSLVLIGVGAISYLVYALAPYQFWDYPTSMRWMPFASSLQGSIGAVVSSVSFEALCFGAMIWGAVIGGGSLVRAALCTALLAFACEWAQRYLPGRTAEITSVLTAIVMAWLVAGHARARYRRSELN